MDQVIYFSACPRCNEKSFEVLKTYGHCVQCNYFTDEDIEASPAIPKWAKDAVNEHLNPVQETPSVQLVA